MSQSPKKKTTHVKKKPVDPLEGHSGTHVPQLTVEGFPRTTAYLPGDIVLLKDGAAGVIVEAARRVRHKITGNTLDVTVEWNEKLKKAQQLELTKDPAAYKLSALPGFPVPSEYAWYIAHDFYSVIKGPLHALFEKPGTLERKLRSMR